MKTKLTKELKNYDTELVSIVAQPVFLWDCEDKSVVTEERGDRKQYYKPMVVQTFQLSENYNLDKWFEDRKGRNIVFYLNGDSIFWEENRLRAMVD
jgi:hypothetical protein